MSSIIESNVIEPPTGGEILQRVLADLTTGEFELILLPEQEVPKAKPIPLKLLLRAYDRSDPSYNSTIVATALGEQSDQYASVVIRIPHDTEANASASLITR